MPSPNKEDDVSNGGSDDTNKTVTPKVEPDVESVIQKRVEEALAPIKTKLDTAFAARDEAQKKAKEAEDKLRAAELQRLTDEGKHTEALQMQLEEAKKKAEALEQQNLELTRDNALRSALSSLPSKFRNANAMNMAYQEIVATLIKDATGSSWVHRSGISIADAVKLFADNPDNLFLFEQKASTGGGSQGNKQVPDTSSRKGLSELSQADVLSKVAAGTLSRQRNRN